MRANTWTLPMALAVHGLAATPATHAQPPQVTGAIFENVRIFSGTSD